MLSCLRRIASKGEEPITSSWRLDDARWLAELALGAEYIDNQTFGNYSEFRGFFPNADQTAVVMAWGLYQQRRVERKASNYQSHRSSFCSRSASALRRR